MIRRIVITAVTLATLVSQSAFAVEPDEILADPVLEERARAISKQVRCVVCQNQDIDSSNAGVAR
ncbi:cytochrome c-type biogenesis protein, partial [Ruegeria sp. HU-ET01832]